MALKKRQLRVIDGGLTVTSATANSQKLPSKTFDTTTLYSSRFSHERKKEEKNCRSVYCREKENCMLSATAIRSIQRHLTAGTRCAAGVLKGFGNKRRKLSILALSIFNVVFSTSCVPPFVNKPSEAIAR